MLVHINKMQRTKDMKKTRDFSCKNVLLYSVVHLCCTKKMNIKQFSFHSQMTYSV